MDLSFRSFFSRLSPITIAIALSVLLIVWLLLGDNKQALEESPERAEQSGETLPQVEVEWLQAEPYSGEIVVQGQVEPWQQVAVRAQVGGRIDELLKQQGDSVQKGEALLALTDEGRAEQLAQAQALLSLRQTELESGVALEKSRFVPETEISRLRSDLASAKSALRAAQLAAEYSEPKAPFDGVISRRHVELGELVSPGAPLMELVDITKVKITAYVPQQQVSQIEIGQEVSLVLLDGRHLDGEVLFISPSADQQTRSFYIEIAASNSQLWRIAGSSATASIHLPSVEAHKLSPSLLSLDEQGRLGLYIVDEQNKVLFQAVDLVAVDNESATVQNLPSRVRVITLGAGFVDEGQEVRPVERDQ